jgi:hypothetical protein
MSEMIATLSFQAEAYESAAAFFNLLTPFSRNIATMENGLMPPVANGTDSLPQGYTVHVVTTHGDEFDAEVRDVIVDHESDGQYKLVVWQWDDETGKGNPDIPYVLDLYDDLVRVEVI